MISKTFFAFGTANTITVDDTVNPVAPASDAANTTAQSSDTCNMTDILTTVVARMQQLHQNMNLYDAASEVSAICANAGICDTPVSADTYAVIERALQYAAATDGAFDITLQPLIRLWKESADEPKPKALAKARKQTGYQNIILNNQSVRLAKKQMGIDLGGIAKGYAADVAAKMLKEAGITDAILNFGGTVVTFGAEKTVGIQDPFGKTGQIIGSIQIKDKAVVTSGEYERGRHIIDPRTGRPAQTDLASVTLIGTNACQLDALATGVFVLGLQRGYDIIRQNQLEAILITRTGDVFTTEGIRENFHIKNISGEKNTQCMLSPASRCET